MPLYPPAFQPMHVPADHGYLAWSYDPSVIVSSTAPGTAGRLEFARVKLPSTASVTNVVMENNTAGSTLTTGQCFAALYDPSRALIAQTADMKATWEGATGIKAMALAGGPFTLPPGYYLVAFWHNGTTAPTWVRTTNFSSVTSNMGLSSPNLRYGSADTGLTTTAPSTMGAQTAQNTCWWVALS